MNSRPVIQRSAITTGSSADAARQAAGISAALATRLMPTLEPCVAGFTASGRPSSATARSQSAAPPSSIHGGVATPAACASRFVQDLVHADCRTEHPAAGVGQAQPFERPLHGAVLAARTVQRDPHAVEIRRDEFRQRARSRIECNGIHAARDERLEHGIARHQGNLAFRRGAAHQYGDLAELGRILDAPECTPLARRRLMRARTSRRRARDPRFARTPPELGFRETPPPRARRRARGGAVPASERVSSGGASERIPRGQPRRRSRRVHAASPITRTSGTSRTPCTLSTVACT